MPCWAASAGSWMGCVGVRVGGGARCHTIPCRGPDDHLCCCDVTPVPVAGKGSGRCCARCMPMVFRCTRVCRVQALFESMEVRRRECEASQVLCLIQDWLVA